MTSSMPTQFLESSCAYVPNSDFCGWYRGSLMRKILTLVPKMFGKISKFLPPNLCVLTNGNEGSIVYSNETTIQSVLHAYMF